MSFPSDPSSESSLVRLARDVSAHQTETPYEDEDFFAVPTYKTVTFLILFTVSFLFTMGLFFTNVYKTMKIASEQKVLFRQASMSMKRDTMQHDLKMFIGKKMSSRISQSHKAK